MNCKITLSSSFSGVQADILQPFPAQLAASARKSALNRPFILPILLQKPHGPLKKITFTAKYTCYSVDIYEWKVAA